MDTEQCLSDKIETFALDEDFDYDNVVLTPKFLVDDRSESSTCYKCKKVFDH